MKPPLINTLLFCVLCLTSVAQVRETGVSQKLASSRKKIISNVKYQLNFHIPKGNRPISVKENIFFDLNDVTKEVLIDFKSDAKQVKKLIVNGKIVKLLCSNEHIVIEPEILRRKDNQVKIDFICSEKSIKIDSGRLAYCFFVPANARKCFPCFDQPDIKANFKLTLTVDSNWLAVSNASIATSKTQNGETTWEFGESDLISTYLFSFAAGKFKRYTETRDGRTINFYYQETQQKKVDSSLKRCMELNFKALAFNIAYLDGEYPFQKFDFVEIPGFSVGGMEHPGAIFYSGKIIFLDEASTSEQYYRNLTIGHETSHMWFGDLVTMKWFNEVWLKEVFANYIGNKFANRESPDSGFNKKFLLNNFPHAYLIDRYPSSDPIIRDLPNLDQAGLVYGDITYNKAPIMMHQLELLLGEDIFKKGVQDYIKRYKRSNADFSQLIEEFKKYTQIDLDSWLTTWVKKAGRPLFYYKLDTAGGTIHNFYLSQYGEYDSSLVWRQKFDIMLCYDSGATTTIKIDMKSHVQQIMEAEGKKSPKFILFNTSGEGYGVFPIDKFVVEQDMPIVSVEARASAVINLYERMLRLKQHEYNNGFFEIKKQKPKETLHLLASLISKEPDQQLLERELRYIEFIYWRLLKPTTRKQTSVILEKALMDAIHAQPASKRTAIFRTYMRIAQTSNATDFLFLCWDKRSLPDGIKFGTNDWNQLAAQLALRNYHAEEVLKRQLDSLSDYNARKSFSFLTKALSTNVNERDAFFNSLLTPEGRKVESDVIDALHYLHHPLRYEDSRKYIKQSLAILPTIWQANDIFFAPDWIAATLENYQDDETTKILKLYLSKPTNDIPYLLFQKVRQSADLVLQAALIAE